MSAQTTNPNHLAKPMRITIFGGHPVSIGIKVIHWSQLQL
jgi:hypothetical protein